MEINSTLDYVTMTRHALAVAGFVRRELGGTRFWIASPDAADPRTIVLVHGANDQAGTWFAVAPALARRSRVIIPDLPGHGESEPSSGPLPLPLLVARLHAVIAKETDGAVTLVGNSLGGFVSILYTLAHPERVEQLILEDSGGLTLALASPVVASTPDEAKSVLRAAHGPQFEPKDWMIEGLLARSKDSPMLRLTETEDHFVDSRLREIRVPTTLIWGSNDGILPLSYAQALQRGIAGANLHVIEGAAHIPHLQQPERFLACLTAIC